MMEQDCSAEIVKELQIESNDDERIPRTNNDDSTKNHRQQKEEQEENNQDVVATGQSSSADDVPSEDALKEESKQEEGNRNQRLLQRQHSRSNNKRRTNNDGSTSKRKHNKSHREKRDNKLERSRSKRKQYKKYRALTPERSTVEEDVQTPKDEKDTTSPTPLGIMNDIRNYKAWDDEEAPSNKEGKNKEKEKENKKAKQPRDGDSTRLNTKKWILIILLSLVIIMAAGLAYLFLIHLPNADSADELAVSEKTVPTLAPVTVESQTSPTAAPSIFVVPPSTASPSQGFMFDPPSENDCVAIANGEMIVGQEELPVETLFMDMDITLNSANSGMGIADVTDLLANKIQQELVPEFTGCKEEEGGTGINFRRIQVDDDNDEKAMKYIIANARVQAFQSANGVCTSSPESALPCFKVAVLFDLAVKADNVKTLTLYRRISDSFGEGKNKDGEPSLLQKLRLEDLFQEILVAILYIEDISVAPTITPSQSPSVAPTATPSISPSGLPTSQPSKIPTQTPTNFESRDPTNPPSPNPTENPTRPPTPPPTPNPTPPPTESPVQTTTALTSPQEIVSSNGILSTSLNIVERSFTIPNSNIQINSRLLGGQFPGPTLRLRAGDTLQIAFSNDLSDQGLGYVHNSFSGVDDSNLHFHGLYVSGELPSDDVTQHFSPGESYTYSTDLPSVHMGGTFWMHPHRHGATALQVGGGANCVIIVEDEDGTLPSEVQNAREVIFIAQYFDVEELREIAEIAGDNVFSISGHSTNEFLTVNGQMNPTIEVDAGEWIRLRVVWVNFLQGNLDLRITNCEMQLLAKDGVYIRDYPRQIFEAEVPSGGRADIMVRCPDPSTAYTIYGLEGGFATIQTSSVDVNSASLQSWSPTYPDYLTDLRNTAASSGCSCGTSLRRTEVNGRSYPSSESYLHQTYIGAVVERDIAAVQHPYHQHVYPFQLVGGSSSTYNAIGDWHDVVKGRFNVRYSPDRYSGKLMIHCHRLVHEDRGMMAVEQILDSGSCGCNV